MRPKARAVLANLLAAESVVDPDYEAEVVCEGRSCWIGCRRVPPAAVDELLRLVALKDVSEELAVKRYRINDVGRALHRRPEVETDIVRAIMSGGSFTINNDEVVAI